MTTPTYPEWVVTESEKKLHDDFRAFVWLIWFHLKLPPPTKRQLAICRYLQYGPRRRMVQAFRGIGKSWLTAAYVLWRLYRNPQERVKVVSANEDKAVEFATFTRRLIEEIPQLQFLRPKNRDSTLAFDVGPAEASQTPSVSAVGITGQLTGGRATILISDDVEVPKNSLTETQREKLAELVKEYDALVVPEGFDIIYLGTPQTEQSIYNVVRQRGYDCRVWPARYPENIDKYGGALADDILNELKDNPSLAGHSTDPARFSDQDLYEREMSYGRSGFALQFMLDTTLSDAERYPLKLADLIVMDLAMDQGPVRVEYTSDPRNVIPVEQLPNVGFSGDRYHRPMYISEDRAAWQGTVMIIDPSGRGADETAYAILKHLYGMIALVAVGGYRDGYGDTTLEALALKAKEYNVNHIDVESQYGDGMFTKLLEPHLTKHYPCTVEEYKVTGQKEVRIIDDMEPVLNQHKLIVDTRVIRSDLKDAEVDIKYSLFYQLTHITKERGALRHDDRLEVVARGCRYFREQLARDSKRAEEEHKQMLRDQQYEDFMRAAGKSVTRTSYAPIATVLGKYR